MYLPVYLHLHKFSNLSPSASARASANSSHCLSPAYFMHGSLALVPSCIYWPWVTLGEDYQKIVVKSSALISVNLHGGRRSAGDVNKPIGSRLITSSTAKILKRSSLGKMLTLYISICPVAYLDMWKGRVFMFYVKPDGLPSSCDYFFSFRYFFK